MTREKRRLRDLLAAALAVALSTGLSWLLFGRDRLADVVMIYVLGVVLISMRTGYGASLLATVLSVLAFDYLFIPPYFSFSVSDFTHIITFAVMFTVAVVISRLTQRTRDQAEAAKERERTTALLYAMSRDLAATEETTSLLDVVTRHLHDAFDARIVVLLPGERNVLAPHARLDLGFPVDDKSLEVASTIWAKGASNTLKNSGETLFLSLSGPRRPIGVLCLQPRDPARLREQEERTLLEAFAAQIASALERARLAEEAQTSHFEIEAEKMKSSLLSSVSHDLRTPLGVITGATTSLLQGENTLSPEARRDLLETAREEADRLNRLVGNLLDMTRLASGALDVHKELHPVDEMVGVALDRVSERLAKREVSVDVPSALPPVFVDAVLIEQVLINLLENAVKYTPDGSPLHLSAKAAEHTVTIELADRGLGIPEQERERIFDKFYRSHPKQSGGAGLGLAICRGIVDAHGGRIWAASRDGGGSVFHITLPAVDEPEPVSESAP